MRDLNHDPNVILDAYDFVDGLGLFGAAEQQRAEIARRLYLSMTEAERREHDKRHDFEPLADKAYTYQAARDV